MRKLNRFLAVLLTVAMALSLCDLSALAVWLEMDFENGQAVSRIGRGEDEDMPEHRLYTAVYDAATGQFRALGDRDGVSLDFEENSELRLFLTDPNNGPLTDGYRALVLTEETAEVSGTYDALYATEPVTLTGSVAVRDKVAGAEITVEKGSELSVPEWGALTLQAKVRLRGTLRTDANSIMWIDEQSGGIALDGGTVRAEGNVDWGDRNRTLSVPEGGEPRVLRSENYDYLAHLLADAGLVTVNYEQLTAEQKSAELWSSLPSPESDDAWDRRHLDCFAMLIASGAIDLQTVTHSFQPFGKDELETMLSKIAKRALTDRNGGAYDYDADLNAKALKAYIGGVYNGGETLFSDYYENGEWHRELEDILRGFAQLFPRVSDDTTTFLTLALGEYGEPVVTSGTYEGEDAIRSVRFTQPLTLAFDASVSAEETDWLNDFDFENCAFDAGLTVQSVQGKGYGVNFHDSCSGSVTTALPEGVDEPILADRRVDLRELSGMDSVFAYTPTAVNGDRGASLDLWQEVEGESAFVHLASEDVYNAEINWWGWYDEGEAAWKDKEYAICANNYIYRYNEEENWNVAVGASENALALSTDSYEGKLCVAGNVDLSGVKTARGAYMDNGDDCWFNAVALGGSRLTVDGGFNRGVSVTGVGDVVLDAVRNAQITVNGVDVGSAHVFCEYPPFGVYTGMERTVFNENVTDFAVYPGRWNDERQEPIFPEKATLTMEDEAMYRYDLNEHGGVNIFAGNDGWIGDPYQVKFEVTLASGATVTYAPLCYKEGQMAIGKFAAKLRERLSGTLAMVDDDTLARVTGEDGWNEGDLYVDGAYRPDDFAFAVKYGELQRPNRDDDQGMEGYQLTHYGRAEDGVRYGTAKTILQNVYRAALRDDEAILPDSVLLLDDWGWEYRDDEQMIEFKEVYQMLDAFEAVLPPPSGDELPACDAKTITVRCDEDGLYAEVGGERFDHADLCELRFTQALSIVIDDSALDGALDFRFCRFDQDVTVAAPRAALTTDGEGEPDVLGRFELRFHNTCACDGTLRIVEAAEDAALRASAVNKTERELEELPQGEQMKLTAAVYFDALGISGADRLNIETDARVCVDMKRGAVTVNGVTYSSECEYSLRYSHESEWEYLEQEETRKLIGFTDRATASGRGYNDNSEEQSLARALTISGTARGNLRIRGVVDARKLTLGGARLIADHDGGVWTDTYVLLDQGQTLYVDDAEWCVNLCVNDGERIYRPEAWWDGRGGMSVNAASDLDASVWLDGEDVTDGLERDDYGDHVEYRNPDEGDALIHEGNIDRTRVQYQKGGVTVVYDPVPVCWRRVINIGDLGSRMLEWLQENGYGEQSFGGYTVERLLEPDEACDEASVALLESVWTGRSFRWWGEPSWRANIAFALRLMPEGVAQRYSDPNDVIRWGDAKAVMAGILAALGKTNAAFDDGGRGDDWYINMSDRDALYEQFLDQLPPVTEDVAIVLNRDEYHDEYITWNGKPIRSNQIERRTFDGAVTVSYGTNPDETDDWGGMLTFRGCAFNGGLTVEADESLTYGVSFDNSCVSEAPVQVVTTVEGCLQLENLRGMEVEADNGVSFDARDAEDWAAMSLQRYELGAGADRDGACVNFVQAGDWDDEMRIQLRLGSDFLGEDDIALTRNGTELPFRVEDRWEGDGEFSEYVAELRQDGETWFGREELGGVELTIHLGSTTLTLAPPSGEWERPALLRDLVDSLDDMARQHGVPLDRLYDAFGDRSEKYMTCAMAKEVLTEAWRGIAENDEAALPETVAVKDKQDGDYIGFDDMRVLVHLMENAAFGAYSGGSAAELQALLESGKPVVALESDLTSDGDITVPTGVKLFVYAALSIPDSHALTVEGTLINSGTITGDGTGVLSIAASGEYINEFRNGMERAVLENVTVVNNGSVICLVYEDQGLPSVFDGISGKKDYIIYVESQNGFDIAVDGVYNQCVIMDDANVMLSKDKCFDLLTLRDGAGLTVADGATLTVAGEAGGVNLGELTVNGALTVRDGRFTNDGTLTITDGATATVEDDPETAERLPLLVNRGMLRVDGTLTLKASARLENVAEDYRASIAVGGTLVVEAGADLQNDWALFPEGDGVVVNRGTVHMVDRQDEDGEGGYRALNLEQPDFIENGEGGAVAFTAIVNDGDGVAAVSARNRSGEGPRVECLAVEGFVAYTPEEADAFTVDRLILWGSTLTLGNVALTVAEELGGEGTIVLTDGAAVVCDNIGGSVSIREESNG